MSSVALADFESLQAEVARLKIDNARLLAASLPNNLKDADVEVPDRVVQRFDISTLGGIPHCASNPVRRPIGAPVGAEYFDLSSDTSFSLLHRMGRPGFLKEYKAIATPVSYLFDVHALMERAIADSRITDPDLQLVFAVSNVQLKNILYMLAARLDVLRLRANHFETQRELTDYLEEQQFGLLDGTAFASHYVASSVQKYTETRQQVSLKAAVSAQLAGRSGRGRGDDPRGRFGGRGGRGNRDGGRGDSESSRRITRSQASAASAAGADE